MIPGEEEDAPRISDFDPLPDEQAKGLFELHRHIWIEGFKAGFRYAEVPLADDLLDHAALAHFQERQVTL